MPIVSFVNMIYIGNYPDVDPNESGFVAENASEFVGRIAGPGTLSLVEIRNFDNNNGIIGDNDNFGANTAGDFVTYVRPLTGTSVDVNADSTIGVRLRVTLTDGTVVTRIAVLVQMANGDTFITDLSNAGGMDNLSIASIEITQITNAGPSGYFSNQSVDNTIVCFLRGTMIKTVKGLVAIEDLAAGDMVLTLDHGYQPIRWIGSGAISVEDLAAHPNLRPIRIRAGALGANCPETDLFVSPQHRILVRSKIAKRMFDDYETLIAAKHLTAVDGIDVIDECGAPVEYFHFMCDAHQVVFGNNAPSESLYTDPEALKAVSTASRAEILSLFPELADLDYRAKPSRQLVKGRFGAKLAVRHAKNRKPLLEMSEN